MCIEKGSKPNTIAKKIGISSGLITKWKKQETLPNGEILVRLSNYLECSIDFLMGISDSPGTYKPNEEIQKYYNNLNKLGQEKLLNYAIDLSKVEEYKKCDDSKNMNVG